MEPVFLPLQPQEWPRYGMFVYFSQMAPTGYSLTVKLDVTKLRAACKAAQVKFFPAYLWLVTGALNEQIEFKIAVKDGQLGYYDTLTPLYAAFHEDDHTFSLMWTPFHPDFKAFYAAYLENRRLYGDVRGVLSQREMLPPPNSYTVSCLPWVSFEHFAVHAYDGSKPYYFPSIEAGKWIEQADGRTLLPLAITCHHAATDGWHIKTMLETLQARMDAFAPA